MAAAGAHNRAIKELSTQYFSSIANDDVLFEATHSMFQTEHQSLQHTLCLGGGWCHLWKTEAYLAYNNLSQRVFATEEPRVRACCQKMLEGINRCAAISSLLEKHVEQLHDPKYQNLTRTFQAVMGALLHDLKTCWSNLQFQGNDFLSVLEKRERLGPLQKWMNSDPYQLGNLDADPYDLKNTSSGSEEDWTDIDLREALDLQSQPPSDDNLSADSTEQEDFPPLSQARAKPRQSPPIRVWSAVVATKKTLKKAE